MAGAKEIRTKIMSVKNTQKITRAMEMVAASKMRKAQNRMQASRPYANRIQRVVEHIARSNSEYHHQFMERREVKCAGIIVITTDRGLCGGLNANLLRETIKHLQDWQQAGKDIKIALIGRKGKAFFKRVGGQIIATTDQLGDAPSIKDIFGITKVMLDAFSNGEIDELYIASNEFVNNMVQKPLIKSLLPLPRSEENKVLDYHWDYIYEPDAKELLDALLERYFNLQIYHGLLENNACEQSARMIAMKNATDNASNLNKELQLLLNKTRQASITQELTEIVGGTQD